MMKKLFLTIAFLVGLAVPAGAVVWVSPSGNAPGPTGAGNANLYGTTVHGGMNIVGSIVATAIGTPSAPVLTTNGTVGSTSLVYACVAEDYNGFFTIPSATATITTANATLSATNSVNVTCGGQKGALAYQIDKVDTGHVIGYCYAKSNTSCTFVDTGTYVNGNGGASQTSSFTTTANTIDQTGTGSAGPPLGPVGGVVASLPSCVAGINGEWYFVTDSSSISAEGQTCVGSSSTKALAFCSGTAWKCF